jgi:uncharacterized protein YbjT (DUF2867 family)
MILITGAAGKTGKAVAKALLARGAPVVRALIRSPADETILKAMGLQETITGEMDDPNTLSQAMRGVEAIYHICPNVSSREISFATALLHAVSGSSVSRMVYHSVLHPQIEAMPHHWNKMRVEEMLFSSPLDVTILQPAAYMQNILAQWDRMVSSGLYRVPYPVETRLSLVDLDDLAEVAATVLTNAGHSGATYELVGTPPHSQIEIAETFSKAFGKPVRAETETVEAWNRRARAAGMNDYSCETLSSMFRAYARDGLKGNPNVLGWLLGRQPTSLARFAARVTPAQA